MNRELSSFPNLLRIPSSVSYVVRMKNEVYTYCRLSEFDSLGEVYGRMVEVDNNTGYTLVVECSEGKLICRLSIFCQQLQVSAFTEYFRGHNSI